MNKKQIQKLFNTFGIPPNLQGYPYLIHVTLLMMEYPDGSYPILKNLYRQTADEFGVSPDIVSSNIRTVMNNYWNQNNSKHFFAITHYPSSDRLSLKEFLAVVVQYLND